MGPCLLGHSQGNLKHVLLRGETRGVCRHRRRPVCVCPARAPGSARSTGTGTVRRLCGSSTAGAWAARLQRRLVKYVTEKESKAGRWKLKMAVPVRHMAGHHMVF